LAFLRLPSHTHRCSRGWTLATCLSCPRSPKHRAHGEDQDELIEAKVGDGGHVAEHTGGDINELLHEHLERELHARGDVGSPPDREEVGDAAILAIITAIPNLPPLYDHTEEGAASLLALRCRR
jgi:hypothetical protein